MLAGRGQCARLSQSCGAVFARAPALRQAARSGSRCFASEIENPDVRKLADLAHIEVTDEQVAEWEPQLAQVKGFFEQLRAVDVSDVTPSLRASADASLRLREDVPRSHPMAQGFLDQVPDTEGGLIKVPKIATAADNAA